MDHVLFPLFLLEPLLDLGTGLVRLADAQPVTAGTLGALGGNDLHDIAVFQGGIDTHDPVVDLGTYQRIAHTGVDGIRKVNGCGACRQRHDLALGGKHKDLVVEHVDLQGVHIVLSIGILLALQQAADPLKVLLIAIPCALLVLPVGSNTVFCRFVHIPRPDLHLKGNALCADDGGVQTLVHVGLRGGNIVFKPSRHQIEQVVNMTQHIVAIGNGIHDDPECVDIIQFIQGLALLIHLPVDGVNVFDPTIGGVVQTHAHQTFLHLVLNGIHKSLILLFMGRQIAHNALISYRIQIPQRNILQFPLDLLHTEPVRQRRIHVHGFPTLDDLLFRGLVLHSAHVVQPVRNLDEHHPDILGHSHEHLSQIFHLLFFAAGKIRAGQLGNTLYQLRSGVAEALGNILIGSIGILDAIMEQRAQNRICVQTHLHHDLRHRQGVDNVGRTVLPLLGFVFFLCVCYRCVDQLHVHIGHAPAYRRAEGFIMFNKTFHIVTPLISTPGQLTAAAWSCFGSDPPFPG